MRVTLGWVAVAVVALFVVFNLDRAHVWFFGIRVEMPLGLVVIGSALLGAVATSAFRNLRRRSG